MFSRDDETINLLSKKTQSLLAITYGVSSLYSNGDKSIFSCLQYREAQSSILCLYGFCVNLLSEQHRLAQYTSPAPTWPEKVFTKVNNTNDLATDHSWKGCQRVLVIIQRDNVTNTTVGCVHIFTWWST